ncbi:MAG: hypothetical protein FWC16_05265 [Defluviitaleaceae bacterium]|nr:hypothetical protein [Defluviitaleaceae bacterium]
MHNPLRNNKGVSLIFVLAFMLLLMALSVSVLTAAGLSFRAVFAQQERNQRNLLVESMGLTLYAALNENRTEAERYSSPAPQTLTEIILAQVYNEFKNYFWPDFINWMNDPDRNENDMPQMGDVTFTIHANTPAGMVGTIRNTPVNDMHYEITVHIGNFTPDLSLDPRPPCAICGSRNPHNFNVSFINGGYIIEQTMYYMGGLIPIPIYPPERIRIPAEIVFNGTITFNQQLKLNDDTEAEVITSFQFNYGLRERVLTADEIAYYFPAGYVDPMIITPASFEFMVLDLEIQARDALGELMYDENDIPIIIPWTRWTVANHEH